MFETLFLLFYLKVPRTVSSAISLGLSLDSFTPLFFFSSFSSSSSSLRGMESRRNLSTISGVYVSKGLIHQVVLVPKQFWFQRVGQKKSRKRRNSGVEHRVVLIFV